MSEPSGGGTAIALSPAQDSVDATARAISIRLSGGWQGVVRCRADEAMIWQVFLETLARDDASLPGHTVLKYAEDRGVIRVTHPLAPRRVACRRIHVRGFATFRGVATAARRDFSRMTALSESGVRTTTPLAYIERSTKGHESWLVTEFLDDAMDLARIVLVKLPRLASTDRTGLKRRLSRATAVWLFSLTRAGWRHRDFKASNVLVCHIETESPPVLVADLEGLRRRRWWHGEPGRREAVRLFSSLLGTPTLGSRDAARFLRDFERLAGGRGLGSTGKLLREAESYLRRARKRKTHKLDGFSGA